MTPTKRALLPLAASAALLSGAADATVNVDASGIFAEGTPLAGQIARAQFLFNENATPTTSNSTSATYTNALTSGFTVAVGSDVTTVLASNASITLSTIGGQSVFSLSGRTTTGATQKFELSAAAGAFGSGLPTVFPSLAALNSSYIFVSTKGQTGDLTSLSPSAPAAIVPEPATWGMMALGMGIVGSAMRRRKPAAKLAR